MGEERGEDCEPRRCSRFFLICEYFEHRPTTVFYLLNMKLEQVWDT